ncbi:hypothetical protein G3A56_25665 (plasmid) [Rhizobium oryzihabitans]|uniref:Telomere resolvase ResT/TelK catalytic domain-containing protein n=1 Tax=Rhizobium oryzihabitans TaxID=2267833 RepID=A0A7L5BQM7_9HYPH|nr:protelomerase family protein [Rhizobium oryzihabitans]QIB41247.1 hypothetical protein G3A56_25665 [Rhizobium oryzihabitans]
MIEAKKIKAHNVRALYAEIADQFFRPKSKTKAAFFAEALGHTEKDIETASSYMKYYLPIKKMRRDTPGKKTVGEKDRGSSRRARS